MTMTTPEKETRTSLSLLKHTTHKHVRKNLGQRLAGVYRNNYKTYQAVDFTNPSGVVDVFRRQGGQLAKLGTHLLGTKTMAMGALAQGVFGKDKISEWSETLYHVIAQGAEYWARRSLANESRFANLTNLSMVARHDFIQEMNDKNRVLASLGGVFGFMGLKGVVLDTAWLLLVSLKAVYELSMIYGKPLSKKEGAVVAYGILAGCELDKLQEKQVIMTALALGDGVLANTQNANFNLLDELKKFASTYQYDGRHLDEVAKYVDLNKFNTKWLHRLLPVGSAVVAVHYNNRLLENVLGVAMATFAKND